MDSLNIGIASPSFSVWSGFFVNPDLPIVLVVEYETQAHRAQLELARIGFDRVVGFITADDLDEKQQITQLGARDFLVSLESPQRPVISTCDQPRNGLRTTWKARFIFRCRSCSTASENFPERCL